MRISDWSSDVCSSDLAAFSFDGAGAGRAGLLPAFQAAPRPAAAASPIPLALTARRDTFAAAPFAAVATPERPAPTDCDPDVSCPSLSIGRTSLRARVGQYV